MPLKVSGAHVPLGLTVDMPLALDTLSTGRIV